MRPWKILRRAVAGTANNMQIVPTITTITPALWRGKLAEVKKFKLKEVCLFLTCLDLRQRKEFYSLFKETGVKTVPLAHIRSDMELWELDYLAETYKTKAFNTHTKREYAHLRDYGKYRKNIYIENGYEPFDEVCLDISHLESDRLLRPDSYGRIIEFLKRYPPQCSHVSAVKKKPFLDENGHQRHSLHTLADLSEFDYLEKYPLEFFGEITAIELENTIEEQLKAKEYISALIKNK